MATPNFSGPASVVAMADASGNPFTSTNLLPVGATLSSGYPAGATPITASATGTTGATTATLAAAVGNATVTGTITGTLNFTQFTGPAASSIGIVEPAIGAPGIPGSATNTAIAVISAAPGVGGVVSVSAWGYQL